MVFYKTLRDPACCVCIYLLLHIDPSPELKVHQHSTQSLSPEDRPEAICSTGIRAPCL